VWLAKNYKEFGCGLVEECGSLIPKFSVAILEFTFSFDAT